MQYLLTNNNLSIYHVDCCQLLSHFQHTLFPWNFLTLAVCNDWCRFVSVPFILPCYICGIFFRHNFCTPLHLLYCLCFQHKVHSFPQGEVCTDLSHSCNMKYYP